MHLLRALLAVILSIALIFFQIETLSAQQEKQPKIVRYGGWSLACDTLEQANSGAETNNTLKNAPNPEEASSGSAGNTKKSNCSLFQRLSAKDSREIVFAFSVLPAAKVGQFAAILSVPLGGYIAPGMELKVDQGKPFKVLFETCNAGGCHGGFELGGRILKEMQSGKELVVRLWTSKNKPVDVRIDLNRFGNGFAELRGRT